MPQGRQEVGIPDEKQSQQCQRLIEAAGKHLDIYTGAIHPWSERITYLSS